VSSNNRIKKMIVGSGGVQLNVGSELQGEAWYLSHFQSFAFGKSEIFNVSRKNPA
jgi:hypothetical protein